MELGEEQRELDKAAQAVEVGNDAREDLERLMHFHAGELAELPWWQEGDRWAELVFCLINAHYCGVLADASPEDVAEASRAITDTLSNIGLIEPAELAKAAEREQERTVLIWVLGRYLDPSDAIDSLIDLLTHTARVTTERYDGKIQRLLRAKGEELRDELAAMFDTTNGPTMRQAAALWLQNVANLPVWVDDGGVRTFCEGRGYPMTELEQAADEIGLNLALLDDIIRLEMRDAAPGDEGQ
ncbi:hypothetical protein [Haloechinothrix halophila]|uniref:hypothetical protein n=1 Tax=Haloechinothrix halophila TaxID=1069073 RepID=UPI0004261313|nr:hypothetical protein [Haloechinothrix halophila]